MMKKINLLALALLLSVVAAAQGGKIQTLTMRSNILAADKELSVYLPAGYKNSRMQYPVLYLLHGASDTHTAWAVKGNMQIIVDEAIASGMALPMIVVMPDAKGVEPNNMGRNMGYFNYPEWAYMDYFFKELIPYVEKNFRTKGEKRYRAISGLSMGGGGTAVYAERHPEMFSSACPMSGAFDTPKSLTSLGDEWAEVANAMSAIAYVQNADQKQVDAIKTVRWMVECGDDDFLFESTINLIMAMREKGILVELRIRNGGHNWVYWQTSLSAVLQFISIGFATEPPK